MSFIFLLLHLVDSKASPKNAKTPIINAVYSILYEGKNAELIIEYINNDKKPIKSPL